MYTVILSNCGNIDHNQNPYGLLQNTSKGVHLCNTLEGCVEACQKYIADHDLGGGNWDGGQVYENNVQIAYISYNGRIWKRGDKYFSEKNQDLGTN
jgi:hypothetical protein